MDDVINTPLLFQDIQLLQVAEQPLGELSFDGNNAARFLLLYKLPFNDPERQMLEKMLSALKLTWNDVAFLRIDSSIPFHFLKDRIFFNILVAFGFHPAELGLNIIAESYKPLAISDTRIIFCESIPALFESKQSKEKLWIALKEIFAKN